MVFQLEWILKSVPVVFSELEYDFSVLMKAKLAFVFVEADVVDMVEVQNDFLSILSAESLDLIGKGLLVKERNLDDEDMGENLELPEDLDVFVKLFELDGGNVSYALLLTFFGVQDLDFESLAIF